MSTALSVLSEDTKIPSREHITIEAVHGTTRPKESGSCCLACMKSPKLKYIGYIPQQTSVEKN